jgi:hypothetical protein
MYRCELCNVNLNKYYYDKHENTKNHQHKLKMYNIKLNEQNHKLKLKNSTYHKFEFRNKKGNIICETFVDKDVYYHIINNNFKLSYSSNYARINYMINNIKNTCLLHHYIYYIYFINDKSPNMVIDHINNDKLDNRIHNLREITQSDNNRNKLKSINASSQYYGVKKHYNKWQCCVNYNDIKYTYVYENEIHAAHHYDLMIKEFNLQFNKLNNVDKPEDFVLKVKRVKNKLDNLPLGIMYASKNTFYYKINCKKICGFKTVNDAVESRNKYLEEKRMKKVQSLQSPIKRNDKNIAIIKLYKKKKEIGEILVSDEDYYKVISHKWNLPDKYVMGHVNNKPVMLSRFIMNCNDANLVVDHIDGNTLNNTRNNLRILTTLENSQNKSKKKNTSSQYIGVSYVKSRKKWLSQLVSKGKPLFFKYFNSELEAAQYRNNFILELNKTDQSYYKINIIK